MAAIESASLPGLNDFAYREFSGIAVGVRSHSGPGPFAPSVTCRHGSDGVVDYGIGIGHIERAIGWRHPDPMKQHRLAAKAVSNNVKQHTRTTVLQIQNGTNFYRKLYHPQIPGD